MCTGALKEHSRAEPTPAVVRPSPVVDHTVSAGLQADSDALRRADAVERHSCAAYAVRKLYPHRIVVDGIAGRLASNPQPIRDHSIGRELQFEIVCRVGQRGSDGFAACVRIPHPRTAGSARIGYQAPGSFAGSFRSVENNVAGSRMGGQG